MTNHSNAVIACQIQRFKTRKLFQWTFLNSPKQSPCTGKRGGVNTVSPAFLLARPGANLSIFSSSLVSLVRTCFLHCPRHNNKTLGGLKWWQKAKAKVPEVRIRKNVSCEILIYAYVVFNITTVLWALQQYYPHTTMWQYQLIAI